MLGPIHTDVEAFFFFIKYSFHRILTLKRAIYLQDPL